MQSPNNPLTPTEASKFPLEVLRVGPERETEGRETTTKAVWGWLKQLGGTVAGSLAVKIPGARVARPFHAHCSQDTQTAHRTIQGRSFIYIQSAIRRRGCLHNWKEKCKTQEGEKCLFWRGISLASEVSDHVLQQSPGR